MKKQDVFIGTLDELANRLCSEYIQNSSFQGGQLNYSPSKDVTVPAVITGECILAEMNGKTAALTLMNAAEIPLPQTAPDDRFYDASYANEFKGKTFFKGQVYQLTLFGVYYDSSSNLIAFYPALPGEWAAWGAYWSGKTQDYDVAVWAVVNHLEGEALTAVENESSFGHTVDFISEGTPYARYMVTDGQSVAKPSPDPTKSGLHFDGWKDNGGNTITFPYTPTSDIQLAAQFVLTREGMVLTEANKLICTIGGSPYRKAGAGWAIAGYSTTAGGGAKTGPTLVALTAAAADYGFGNGNASFVYKGTTYYYFVGWVSYWLDGYYDSTATDVADLYKCTGNSAEAALLLVKRYLNEI